MVVAVCFGVCGCSRCFGGGGGGGGGGDGGGRVFMFILMLFGSFC